MRNRAELRDEIFAAARAEFARYGLAGARIDRVAKEARASKERLYAHFGDKENLFREVVAADTAQFLGAVVPRPEALPEFVGDIYDLARTHPEHIRMITWARLEQLELIPPDPDKLPAIGSAVIAAAQADGHVDPHWDPDELLVMLFGIGMAWATWLDPNAATDDAATVAARRAAAVEAAARLITVRS
ncbi:TetR family transcriptional regulator [Mycobacterium sp. UM_Kg1]|uniref:TetR/AcrR family transcriptional regulator n=1 Tax=Mycobacterium sp. UM_Kg1 TaxID=1545691 RepID=UPI00061A8EEE|nr:TetR family transcriptional regulator [Mycobacterium sp. UM_Kg1]